MSRRQISLTLSGTGHAGSSLGSGLVLNEHVEMIYSREIRLRKNQSVLEVQANIGYYLTETEGFLVEMRRRTKMDTKGYDRLSFGEKVSITAGISALSDALTYATLFNTIVPENITFAGLEKYQLVFGIDKEKIEDARRKGSEKFGKFERFLREKVEREYPPPAIPEPESPKIVEVEVEREYPPPAIPEPETPKIVEVEWKPRLKVDPVKIKRARPGLYWMPDRTFGEDEFDDVLAEGLVTWHDLAVMKLSFEEHDEMTHAYVDMIGWMAGEMSRRREAVA